jgi:hypothetical protein
LEVVVSLPSKEASKEVTSKELNVKFKPQFLQISCRKEPLVNLELFERVDMDGCIWTLEKGGETPKLVITMEKMEQASWPRIKN